MFEIPDELLDLHEQGVDAILNKLGVSCTLYYPPKMTACINCIPNPVAHKSSNKYRTGGPVPFFAGSLCPVCGGEGYKQLVNTDSVIMQIYWEPKQFVNIVVKINMPNGTIRAKGYLRDLPNIRLAREIAINDTQLQYTGGKFRLWGEPITHGFRNNRYFLAYFERV